MAALHENIKSVYDWRCVIVGLENDSPMQTYYLGLGRNNVFRWEVGKSRWLKVSENIEMARDSLVYAELVQELRGEGRSQKRSYALHIIDAVCLGGIDVSQLHLKERSHLLFLLFQSLRTITLGAITSISISRQNIAQVTFKYSFLPEVKPNKNL